jgi:molybdopterin synthase sulfur carrier subunit
MSTVRIPSTMRAAIGGAKDVEISGTTLREVIDGLVAAHPVLGSQLLDAKGELNRFVNVFVNETDARYLDSLDTAVGASDRVVLLPAMAGG